MRENFRDTGEITIKELDENDQEEPQPTYLPVKNQQTRKKIADPSHTYIKGVNAFTTFIHLRKPSLDTASHFNEAITRYPKIIMNVKNKVNKFNSTIEGNQRLKPQLQQIKHRRLTLQVSEHNINDFLSGSHAQY